MQHIFKNGRIHRNKQAPACLVVRVVATRQKVPGLNLDSRMDKCNVSDSILNEAPDLFGLCVQKMTIVPATNQPQKQTFFITEM